MLTKYTKSMSKSYECKLSKLNFPKDTALFVWWKTVLLSLHIWRHKQPIFSDKKCLENEGKMIRTCKTYKHKNKTNKLKEKFL